MTIRHATKKTNIRRANKMRSVAKKGNITQAEKKHDTCYQKKT